MAEIRFIDHAPPQLACPPRYRVASLGCVGERSTLLGGRDRDARAFVARGREGRARGRRIIWAARAAAQLVVDELVVSDRAYRRGVDVDRHRPRVMVHTVDTVAIEGE